MSDSKASPAAENAANTGATSSALHGATGSASSGAAPKGPATAEQNPAFRMMGLPRLRLPSRNWLIFLSITGSFASAVYYDKWQTRRIKQKWCDLVSHIPDEALDTKSMPRRLTIYLAAPPGDGLRSAREHFHDYIKPVLVAGAMDWDVVEGRKEGDVRFKTAERIRRKRKRNGEGEPLEQDEMEKQYSVDAMRERNGTTEYAGVAGDLVIGRHTWKEYIRGLHEGWLGPADAPKQPEPEIGSEVDPVKHIPGQPSLGDAAVKGAANVVAANTPVSTLEDVTQQSTAEHFSQTETMSEDSPKEGEEKKEVEEKPRPRQPPPYITPSEYPTASLSPSIPETIGPSTAIRFPHILGFTNTPIRIYRFLTRRRLADDVGRQVAAAVLASQHRSFGTVTAPVDEESALNAGREVPEQTQVLAHEEKDWLKTVRQPRKEHEESVWIEDMVLDERIAGRMRRFEVSVEEEERAKRIADGKEVVRSRDQQES